MSKTKERLIYLDCLKLFSAFMVVFYHFGHLYFGKSNFDVFLPNFNYIIMTFSAASIPLFFMVNGALILNKRYSNFSILKKILKLFIIIIIFWKL